jgi:putative tryptophan/tyrosine transport system substrate-binding protein
VNRRDFITLFGDTAAAMPIAAHAQQPAIPIIGFLSGATFEMMRGYVAAFHSGLADAGFGAGFNRPSHSLGL